MRRKGRKAAWEWANRATVQVDSNAASDEFQTQWLLPPNRTSYLMENGRRTHVTHVKTLLWLDFHWEVTKVAGPIGIGSSVQLPTVEFYIHKSAEDATGNNDARFFPYSEPPVPSSLTSWEDAAEEGDGLDSFLWTHVIPGHQPVNSNVTIVAPYTVGLGNQALDVVPTKGSDSDPNPFWCRKHLVTQEWQPDVVVGMKRRLAHAEGLVFGMVIPNQGIDGVNAVCQMAWRTLLA